MTIHMNMIFPVQTRNLKTQKSSKTDSSSIADPFTKIKTNLRNKSLNSRSTSNSANSISWDIDSDGIADALTDGLLLLRYSFGLTGESLVADVISENSTLSTAEIESAIAQVISISDIDADGNVDALTDSLILLRYLFGLTGETLVTGSISTGATRTTATEIETYISGYMPSNINNNDPNTASISGSITFDLIPFNQSGNGLDINSTFASAARGVMVQALDNSGNVVASTITDNNGSYNFETQRDLELKLRFRQKCSVQ